MSSGSKFDMAEIRQAMVLAEQLAKESLSKNTKLKKSPGDEGYVPPTQLLLWLVRMGSFTSALKIENGDKEDNDVKVDKHMGDDELRGLIQNELKDWPPLLQRQWVFFGEKGESIRVMQWNVLAQALGVNRDNFVNCPPEALNWKMRRYRILEEIITYSPDIICLQEIDHYNFLKMTLATQGYEGFFLPKPDSPCIYIKDNNGPDGCAIFYKTDKFYAINKETRIVEVWKVQSNQVAILLNLRVRNTGQEVCIVTTHLKAKEGALLSTLRNEQGKDLCQFIIEHYNNRPIIFCGDFNAENTEPVYSTVVGNERLRLASAYTKLTDDGTEPLYTTWKVRGDGESCHTIDYMFYTSEKLSVRGLLEFPSGEEIGHNRLPCFSYPSDHLSLMCDFEFRDDHSIMKTISTASL